MATFKEGTGKWSQYRELPDLVEVDFHWSHMRGVEPFHNKMAEVREVALDSIKEAQEGGKQYVLFTHGKSTSRPGRTSSRSVIRGLMRSPTATPYIDRKNCIQHESVFVAAIKPQKPAV